MSGADQHTIATPIKNENDSIQNNLPTITLSDTKAMPHKHTLPTHNKTDKDKDGANYADKEYILTLKQALREVVTENDILRHRIKQLEEELQEVQKDLKLKEDAIIELSELIEGDVRF